MSLDALIKKMNDLAKGQKIEKAVAQAMLVETSDRIFTQGKDATGAQIGTYSAGYQKTRRKKGWPASTKVILQAERQMVNDWSVIQSGESIGLGFKNQKNLEKSNWVEETYEKDIFKHTPQEEDLINDVIQDVLNSTFK